MIYCFLDPRRFEALAGYARSPEIALITQELIGTPAQATVYLALC